MGKYGEDYSRQCRERKTPAEDDLIEYRWLNMDNQCYTTEEALYKYASAFPRGIHKVVSEGPLLGGPVLRAYGTREYTFDQMRALDARLAGRRSGDA